MKRIIIILIIAFLTRTILAQDATVVYRNSVNSTVTIETDIGLGSGFFVGENVIVTNFHVIEGASEAHCFTNNSSTKYKIEGYLAVDKSVDLILLKVLGLNRTALKMTMSSVSPGQKVYVIGSPKGLPASISDGIVSGLRNFDGKELIQITAPISPGSSGGPVLNINGEVIGVSVGQFKDGQNLNFAIPKSNLEVLLKLKTTNPGLITNLYDLIRPLTDSRDGKTYKTIKIGSQIWMAENLNYTSTSGSWCYNGDKDNCSQYGRLYNWETAQSSCPAGWHLPTNDDWHKLVLFLDPDAMNEHTESHIAGGKLKSIEGWEGPNAGATNESGFSALPGGVHDYDGAFRFIGRYGNWWSSTEYESYVLCRELHYDNSNVGLYFGTKSENTGLSVRCIKDNTLTDLDGNVYKTILIGTQTWMAENLRTTKFNDGTSIPMVIDSTSWTNRSTPAYCWLNNDQSNSVTYGALYNWYAVNTGKLCPTNWHVPSDSEWIELTNYLGGERIAGGKLKSITGWENPNTDASNETGFSALPGGNRISSSAALFDDTCDIGCWWSTTEFGKNLAWNRLVYFNSSKVQRFFAQEAFGLSVRCIRNY